VNYLSGLASNWDLLNLNLPNSQDYRCKSPTPAFNCSLFPRTLTVSKICITLIPFEVRFLFLKMLVKS
jgi:hypothetical protein